MHLSKVSTMMRQATVCTLTVLTENILFNLPFDETRYKKTLEVIPLSLCYSDN